ncbi:hypothetical protein Tsubulata_017171 [Turnera subulata]|uniref:Uncharacterized protein n=1 Tax=Turnera subulata TaxID=218843 RepID=A0A9Q0GIM7_9ROSI|nr:hypothetical protein Tsubulata_017171 [Turnera subulata]
MKATKKTKEAGISGKYGTRSGASLRKYFKRINGKHFCESCGKYAVKRNAGGILACKVCDKVKGGFASNLTNQEESGVSGQPKDHAPICGSTSHAPAYSAAAAAQESLNAAIHAANLAAKTVDEFAAAKHLEDVADSALSSYRASSVKVFEALRTEAANFRDAKADLKLHAAEAEEAANAANAANAAKAKAKAKAAAAAAAYEVSVCSAAAAKEAAEEYVTAAEAAAKLADRVVKEYTEASRLEYIAASALASYQAALDQIRQVLLPKSAEFQAAKAAFRVQDAKARKAAEAADDAKVVADAKAAEADRVAAAEASQVADAAPAVE